MQTALIPECEKIAYFGRGPVESYKDKCHASRVSLFKTSVTDHFEPYVRPQENMAHNETKWVMVYTEAGQGLLVTGSENMKYMSFNCSHYTPKMLAETAHDYELIPLDETILNIDYAHSGIGSQSCGPALDERYRLSEKSFTFEARLMPVFTANVCPFAKSAR